LTVLNDTRIADTPQRRWAVFITIRKIILAERLVSGYWLTGPSHRIGNFALRLMSALVAVGLVQSTTAVTDKPNSQTPAMPQTCWHK